MQAVVKHEVCLVEAREIVGLRNVLVRIDARSHEAVDLDALAADLARDVGDHAGGGQDAGLAVAVQRPLRSGVVDAPAAGHAQGNDQKQKHKQARKHDPNPGTGSSSS